MSPFISSCTLIAMTVIPGSSFPDPIRDDAAVSSRDVVDFSRQEDVDAWRSVDDVVMGGISSSRILASEDGTGLFVGTVSLENNGGFASARSMATLPDADPVDGLMIEVRGDGRVYKLSLRGDRALEGVTWQAPFATIADTWTKVRLPLHAFSPNWRGRLVTSAGAFVPDQLRSIGLSISDKQAGDFQLEVRRISVWSSPETRRHAETLAALIDTDSDTRAHGRSDPTARDRDGPAIRV
jgi:NADH dehydrogenase [ubiquinone] 1 alpha subcomplex assembly factor 1